MVDYKSMDVDKLCKEAADYTGEKRNKALYELEIIKINEQHKLNKNLTLMSGGFGFLGVLVGAVLTYLLA